MSTEEQYRAGFEAWFARTHGELGEHLLRRYDNGEYRNTAIGSQFEAWAEAKRDASTEPSESTVYLATTRGGDTCYFGYESWARGWAGAGGTVKPVKLCQPNLTVVESAGALTDDAKDAARHLRIYVYSVDGSLIEKGTQFGYGAPGEYVMASDVRSNFAAIEAHTRAGSGKGEEK